MTDFKKIFRAGISSATIAGCVALGVAVFSDTYAGGVGVVSTSQAATKQNFSARGGQCTVIRNGNGSVRGLAIEQGSGQSICVCPTRKAYEDYLRRNPEASLLNCVIENTQNKITNFNQPSTGPGPGPDGPGPGPGGPGPGDGTLAKGNNGWGQEKNGKGNDGTNNGSDNGNAAQAGTKSASTDR
jgi:hypothetical protein